MANDALVMKDRFDVLLVSDRFGALNVDDLNRLLGGGRDHRRKKYQKHRRRAHGRPFGYFTMFRLNFVSLAIGILSSNMPIAWTTMFGTLPGLTSSAIFSGSLAS